jgi:hypothetical protein
MKSMMGELWRFPTSAGHYLGNTVRLKLLIALKVELSPESCRRFAGFVSHAQSEATVILFVSLERGTDVVANAVIAQQFPQPLAAVTQLHGKTFQNGTGNVGCVERAARPRVQFLERLKTLPFRCRQFLAVTAHSYLTSRCGAAAATGRASGLPFLGTMLSTSPITRLVSFP